MVETITQTGPVPDTSVRQRHARAVVTFANSSGTVTVFNITGRVFVTALAAYCTTDLVETGSVTNLELGGATDPNGFIISADPAAIDENEWWADATPVGGVKQADPIQIDVMTDEDVILTITGGTDIASGVIVFDFWYLPVTDGATLVAA